MCREREGGGVEKRETERDREVREERGGRERKTERLMKERE